jgi:hypothetical protein
LGPLSQPKKIKDYYIEEFECFNFKLEEQKQNKKKHPWKKMKKNQSPRNRIPNSKRLPYATIC